MCPEGQDSTGDNLAEKGAIAFQFGCAMMVTEKRIRRRVGSNGTIQVDHHTYYVDSKLHR